MLTRFGDDWSSLENKKRKKKLNKLFFYFIIHDSLSLSLSWLECPWTNSSFAAPSSDHHSPSSLTTTTTNGIESWFLQCWFRVWERNWGLLWVSLMVGLLWNFFVFLGFDFVGLADDWWVWWCKWVWPVIGWFSGVSGFGWWGWWCKWV